MPADIINAIQADPDAKAGQADRFDSLLKVFPNTIKLGLLQGQLLYAKIGGLLLKAGLNGGKYSTTEFNDSPK